MNYRLLAKYLGLLAAALGLVQLIPIIWAIHFGEIPSIFALSGGAVVCLAAGGLLYLVGRNAAPRMLQREALALVGLGWILVSLLGSGPFVLSGLLDPVDGFFESASGFTTTGATIMTNIEAAPASILFYRQMTHWLGGVGIIVLFVAVLPYLGAGGKQIFKSEVTGPDPRGLTPRIRDSARMIFLIYGIFSTLQTVAYMAAGLSFHDAVSHMMGGLSTGGFSPRQASIGAFDSVAVEGITILFMFIGGTSFALFFAMLRGNRLALFKDTEWRVYIGILVAATLVITVNLVFPHSLFVAEEGSNNGEAMGFGEALRAAGFQTVAIMTTTGFVTEDFDAWPHFSRLLLVLLMFIGGCAGSTGGGVKVVRVILLCKMIYARLERTFRPKTIRALRLNGEVVDDEVQVMTYGFFGLYFVVFSVGILFLSGLGIPLETAIGCVIGTLNNIGPGLEHVGPAMDYSLIPTPGKIFLSFYMILGRLELFSIAVFFIPSFWRVR